MNLHIYNINLNVNINVSASSNDKPGSSEKPNSPTDNPQGGNRLKTNSPNKPTDDVGLDPFEMISPRNSDEENPK